MTEPGFTPGPWEADFLAVGGGGQTVARAEIMRREHWETGAGEAQANARLIAAAPALYEALQGMMRHSCVADSAPEDKDGEDHIAESKALAALKQARGGDV